MMRGWRLLLTALFFSLTACVELNVPIPTIPVPSILQSPTPLPAPTPQGDTLTVSIPSPLYNIALLPETGLPGTRLEFINRQGEIYNVRIDGATGQKRAGDSYAWSGIIAPGLSASYNMVLLPNYREADPNLLANGGATFTFFNPQPVESSSLFPVDTSTIYHEEIQVSHLVPAGRTVPGTSLVFESVDGQTVRFSGTNNLSTFTMGDSVRWEGYLRPNIYVINDLRIIGVQQYGLRVEGTMLFYANQRAAVGQ